MRKRLARVGERQQFVERMAGACEKIVRMRGIPGDGDLLALGFRWFPGAASVMVAWVRLAAWRDQGMSMCFGFAMEIAPMIPAAFRVFQRSAAD